MNAITKFGLGLVAAAALTPATMFAAPCNQGQATVRVAPPAAVAQAPTVRRSYSYNPGVAGPTYVAPRMQYRPGRYYQNPALNSNHDAGWKIRGY